MCIKVSLIVCLTIVILSYRYCSRRFDSVLQVFIGAKVSIYWLNYLYHHGKDLAHGWWVSIQKRNNFDTNITFSRLFGPSKVFQGWKTFNSNLKKDSSIRNTFPTIQIMKNLKQRLLTRHPSFQMSVNRYNRQKGIQGFISLCCYMKEIDQRYKNEPMKR